MEYIALLVIVGMLVYNCLKRVIKIIRSERHAAKVTRAVKQRSKRDL